MTVEFLDAAPPSSYTVRETDLPDLADARRSALLGAVRRSPSTIALPPLALTTAGVRATSSGASAYAALLGVAGTDELPAGYVHVLGFPLAMGLMTSREFPLRALGMVHIANRVRQTRSVRFDEDLTMTSWSENLRPHRKGALVDLHLTAAVADGVVWHGVSTYLATGAEVPGEAESTTTDWERPDGAAGLHSWNLPADTGRRYAEVSADANPIHTSRIGARLFGFPRPIAHGMYTAARALAEVPVPAGGALDWAVSFAKPVLLPARASLEFVREGDEVRYALVRRSGSDKVTVHLTGSVAPLF